MDGKNNDLPGIGKPFHRGDAIFLVWRKAHGIHRSPLD
jgi:hypothetical protein